MHLFPSLQAFGNTVAAQRAAAPVKAAKGFTVEANIDYGLGLAAKTTAQKTIPASGRGKCPAALEKGPMPLNTFGNKDPFKGKIVSVERIVGPKATGETTHIIIDHQGKMPYWEGQSYGVIPPVRARELPLYGQFNNLPCRAKSGSRPPPGAQHSASGAAVRPGTVLDAIGARLCARGTSGMSSQPKAR